MKKYCKFLKDVECDMKIIWKEGREYLVTYEDEKVYYFGNPIRNGISKEYENESFIVNEIFDNLIK